MKRELYYTLMIMGSLLVAAMSVGWWCRGISKDVGFMEQRLSKVEAKMDKLLDQNGVAQR